jgi:hypothetical protein
MFATLRRRFRARPAAARPRPKARLNVQPLDERLVPATTVGLADGVLSITADGKPADIVIHRGRHGELAVQDRIARRTTEFSAAAVQRIDFTGGSANDRFENRSPVPVRAAGGAGNDVLIGGSGDDVFRAGPGRDRYTAGEGRDLLVRDGYRAAFTDMSDKDAVVGLTDGRLTPAELKTEGDLNVYLDGNRLLFSGPTGAGFALRSGWQSATDGDTVKFTTTGPVTLESAWGDVTLPATGGSVSVLAEAAAFPGAGVFDSIKWGGLDVTFSSPTGTYATQLEGLTGGDVGLPNLSWGIALGADVGDDAAPLNPAVPYLYATASTGYSFGYENVEVSPDGRYQGTFAFAPGDGTIYAGITGLPLIGDFALGVSTDGYLPYTPARVPIGMTDPNIYGHYYVRGAVSLDDAGLPVAVGGGLVLDLDANDDGTLLGGAFSQARISQAVRAFQDTVDRPRQLFSRTLRSVFQDVAVGVNTNLDLEFHGLSMELGGSSFWMTPNEIAFRAKTSNPFEGIPLLEDVPNPTGVDVQGFLRRSGQWRASFDVQAGIPGFMTGFHAEAGSGLRGIRVSGEVFGSLPRVGGFHIHLGGTVYFNGDYRLGGSTRVTVAGIEGTLHLGLAKVNGQPRLSWRITR